MTLNIDSTVLLNNGKKMHLFGYGTYKITDEEEIRVGLRTAIENGYRHIDTASLYQNEEVIGKVLKELILEGKVKREDLFITSKLNSSEQGYDKSIEAFNNSCKKLGVDYLDLYLIHWPGVNGIHGKSEENSKIRAQSWLALEKLNKEGKCKSIGVSNYAQQHIQELILNSEIKPQVNQVEFHPFLYQKDLLQYCIQQNIQLEAYTSLVRGADFTTTDKILIEISSKHNKSISQVLLRWGVQHNVCVIPKSKTPERIIENSKIFDFNLSDAEMNQIDSLNSNKRVCMDPNEIK